jgi:hypothetical protein
LIFLCLFVFFVCLFVWLNDNLSASGLDSTVISGVRNGLSVEGCAVECAGIGGKEVTNVLRSSLTTDTGEPITQDLFVDEIKTKLCFVSPIAIDQFRTLWREENRTMDLKDEAGNIVVAGNQRFCHKKKKENICFAFDKK